MIDSQLTNPLVSVIIPTYNREKLVLNAINSVLNQTYKNFELFVVDDGSTDNTRNLESQFGNKLKYILKTHSGQADTRNSGLQYAKGEFIATLDSDDVWNDDFLEKSLSYISDNQLDMFFSNWNHCISPQYNKKGFGKVLAINPFHVLDIKAFREQIFKEGLMPPSSALIVKKVLFKSWNPKINIGDDTYLQFEIIFKNQKCKIGYTEELLWTKNRNINNICDGRNGSFYRNLVVQDIKLMANDFSRYLTKKEIDYFKIRIIQNQILVLYYLFCEKRFSADIKGIFYNFFSQPKLLFFALKTGILKVLIRELRKD